MKYSYHEIAPEVLSEKELLTALITDASHMISTATRLLEIKSDIKTSPKEDIRKNSEYNVRRTLIKRVALLNESIQALSLATDQQADPRLYKTARVAEIDRMVKLQKWHPDEVKEVAKKLDISSTDMDAELMFLMSTPQTKEDSENPYSQAVKEDFDDE